MSYDHLMNDDYLALGLAIAGLALSLVSFVWWQWEVQSLKARLERVESRHERSMRR